MAIPPTVPFLEWAWDDLLFLTLGGILLAAALFVVLGRDIVRSGLAMILAFGALAGIYVLAGAVIVAAAQVLIYIGAISVLILFAIMLTQTKAAPAGLVFHHQAWAGALAAVGVAILLLTTIINTDWPGKSLERLWTSTDGIARLLFSDGLYVMSLQVIGVLLTAAVVGGVFLAKREDAPAADRLPERTSTSSSSTVEPAPAAGSGQR
jgi:NADH:ubiquinone oxidoreductase subunit 6 (subunit J)